MSISLLALDQLNNSREAVWSLEAPGEDAVSQVATVLSIEVPSKR